MEVDTDPAPPGLNNGPDNDFDNGPDNGQFNGPDNSLFNGLDNGSDHSLFNGLATSRHATAPQVAQTTQVPAKTPTIGAEHPQQHPAKALLQDLVALVLENQQAVAQSLAKEVLRLYTAPARLDDVSLKKVVIEGVREALVVLPSPLSTSKQRHGSEEQPSSRWREGLGPLTSKQRHGPAPRCG